MREITQETLADQELLENVLKENEKELKELQSEMKNVQEDQFKLFTQKVEELKTVIEFWKKGYYFSHPTINYRSLKGPILDINERKGLLYVYDYDNKRISIVNTYSMEEEKKEPIWRFFEYCDFDNVMSGLLYVKELQNINFEQLSKAIEEERNKINKYL